MTVAPELFVPEHAIKAITIADEVLRGPVGMRTLDPSDYNYRPYYNNGEDSDDFATSRVETITKALSGSGFTATF